jgi:hypothetical protein
LRRRGRPKGQRQLAEPHREQRYPGDAGYEQREDRSGGTRTRSGEAGDRAEGAEHPGGRTGNEHAQPVPDAGRSDRAGQQERDRADQQVLRPRGHRLARQYQRATGKRVRQPVPGKARAQRAVGVGA